MSNISPTNAKHSSSPASLFNGFHVFLLLITSTQNALSWKAFASFSGFIHQEYSLSYTTLTSALSIATLSTIVALFINHRLTSLNSNVLFFVLCLFQIVGLLLLLLVRHQVVVFVVGLSLLCNVFQVHWGVTNMFMSACVNSEAQRRRYLSIYNSNWTVATFCYIIMGFVIHYYSYWVFLKIMLIVAAVLAVCNLMWLPKISIDSQHQQQSVSKDTLSADLELLVQNKLYRILYVIILGQFALWGLYYVTFGPYLQALYHLDAAEFGTLSALIEGFANSVAILSLCFFKTEHVIFSGAIIQIVDLLVLALITNCGALSLLLSVQHQYVMYCQVFFFFVGNEAIIVGVMILMVQIVPSQKQGRASALVSVGNSIINFVSMLVAGPLYYYGGMAIESIVLCMILALEMMCIFCFYRTYARKQRKQKMGIMNINAVENYSSIKTNNLTND